MSVRRLLLLLPVLSLAACELSEITVAMPRDIIVAEVVLREGSAVQKAYLHRTTSEHGTARVFDATVIVGEVGTGRTLTLAADADSLCHVDAQATPQANWGTCYTGRATDFVRAGGTYTLEITLPDGRRLTGRTTVPGDFGFVVPALPAVTGAVVRCRLEPGRRLELAWTGSAGAWVYIGETRIHELIPALRAAGADIPPRSESDVRLIGLSVGAADTTLVFPAEFGLFDRADEDLHPILLAIRDGLPPGVHADVAVAAADRNYVNWVRGGTFNPSGLVRLPSVAGDGTGVFGSLVTRRFVADTRLPDGAARCAAGE